MKIIVTLPTAEVFFFFQAVVLMVVYAVFVEGEWMSFLSEISGKYR